MRVFWCDNAIAWKKRMSSSYGTARTGAASRHAGHRRFLLALVWLLALPGCSSEQLQSFSEAMRVMNDDIRSTNPTYAAIPQPVLQPSPSQGCIRINRLPPIGTVFQAQLQNTCSETMHVMYGYRAALPGTARQFPWCTPGHAGVRSGTATLAPWQSQPVGPLVHGHLEQVFWCACSDAHARAAFAEPVGLEIHSCRCRCVST